jgi:hypothetical protein
MISLMRRASRGRTSGLRVRAVAADDAGGEDDLAGRHRIVVMANWSQARMANVVGDLMVNVVTSTCDDVGDA